MCATIFLKNQTHLFFEREEFLFQDMCFINVQSRLASIMKGIINSISSVVEL